MEGAARGLWWLLLAFTLSLDLFVFLGGKNAKLSLADEAGWGVSHEIRSGRRSEIWACTHK